MRDLDTIIPEPKLGCLVKKVCLFKSMHNSLLHSSTNADTMLLPREKKSVATVRMTLGCFSSKTRTSLKT